jgi:hypothetical protein
MLTYLPILLAVAVDAPANFNARPILDAIREKETGGEADPANAIGDGGRAIGPYQIHRVYWQDAIEHEPSIGGQYEDCRDAAYAERVILAYWDRYAPDWRHETLARVHNGGPKGHRKSATVGYWLDVRANLR